MSPTFVFRIQPCIDHIQSFEETRDLATQTQDVRVVVGPGHLGLVGAGYVRGPNAPILVGENADTDAGRTDEDSPGDFPTGDGPRHLGGIVGIPHDLD